MVLYCPMTLITRVAKGSDSVFVQIISPHGEVPIELHSSATLTVVNTQMIRS
jgi:hypothetical protein